jgi:hypothetical protein
VLGCPAQGRDHIVIVHALGDRDINHAAIGIPVFKPSWPRATNR